MARRKKTTAAADEDVKTEIAAPEVAAAEPAAPSSSDESSDGTVIEGLAPLARMFGADPNTIRKWIDREDGLPFLKKAEKRGEAWAFDFTAVHKWIVRNEIAKALENSGGGGEGGEDAELKAWELRQKAAQAQLAELKLAEAYAVMIHMDDAVGEREAADAAVRTALLDLPGRYAQAVAIEDDPTKCMHILKDAVEECLAKLVLIFEDVPEAFRDKPETAAAEGEADDVEES